MQDNDIGPTIHRHVACMFEGLLIEEKPAEEERRHWWQRPTKEQTTEDQIDQIARTWRANEKPLKSVIHLVNHLDIGVEVYTYMDSEFHDAIEHWLARKGVSVNVYHYANLEDLAEDFRFNRDVHTLFTPYEEDAARLGIRATVVRPDGTFGF